MTTVRSQDNLSTDILQELKCPVCMKHMVPPIMMCKIGHNICSTCKPKLEKCPICKGKITDTMNLSLGNLARKVFYPCLHSKSECHETHPVDTIEEHESRCRYRPFRCPFHTVQTAKCDWEGSLRYVKPHITDKHTDASCKVTSMHSEEYTNYTHFCVTLPLEAFTSNVKWHKLLVLSQVFLFVCTVKNDLLYACVLYVGHAADACNYEYTVMITKQNTQKVSQSCVTSSYLNNIEDLIEKGYCTVLHRDFVMECFNANEKVLNLTVKIKCCVEQIWSSFQQRLSGVQQNSSSLKQSWFNPFG